MMKVFVILCCFFAVVVVAADGDGNGENYFPTKTSVLTVTHQSIRIQPASHPDIFRLIELPKPPWTSANIIDFDFDQNSQKIALFTRGKNGNDLHLIDFSSGKVVITRAANSTSLDDGLFTADRVRFSSSNDSFWLWSSLQQTPSSSPFININRAKCPSSLTNNRCIVNSFKVAGEPKETAKTIIDVATTNVKEVANGHHFFTLFESIERGTLSSRFHLVDSYQFDTLTPLDYLSKFSMAVARDDVTNHLWVVGLSGKFRLILAKIENFKVQRSFIIQLPNWTNVEKVQRLSVYDNIACISYRSSHSGINVVAIVKIVNLDDGTIDKLPAIAIEINSLGLGAVVLPEKTVENLSRFASQYMHVSHDPEMADRTHDRGYIALIVIGLASIACGIVLAIGSAYFFHLKRRMMAFKRIERIFFKKQGYENAGNDDEVDDDRFLLNRNNNNNDEQQGGTSGSTPPARQSNGYDESVPINA